jgi:hypothetical protein
MDGNRPVKILDSIIDKMNFCINNFDAYQYSGVEEIEESVEGAYDVAVVELKLLLKHQDIKLDDIISECPILFNKIAQNSDTQFIKKSIVCLNGLKDFLSKSEEANGKQAKKFKREWEIEGGLPFLKGKYRVKES